MPAAIAHTDQLSLDDLERYPPLRGLERLGSTVEFGRQLLRLVEADGWLVHTCTRIGGGVLVDCRRGDHRVTRDGDTLADIACDVYLEAMRLGGRILEAA